MRIAFNFAESLVGIGTWSKQLEVEKILLGHLVETVPTHRRHFRIRAGLVPGHRVSAFPAAELPRIVESLAYNLVTAEGAGTWRTIDKVSTYKKALVQNDLLAISVEGVSYYDAGRIGMALDNFDGYLGALQVQSSSAAHFEFYVEPLIYRYRLHEASLWLLHGADSDPTVAGEDNRDHGWLENVAGHFGNSAIDRVEFQSVGLLDSFFDPYRGFDYAKSAGRTEEMLIAYHGAMVDDLLIRFREADPQLIEALHAAFEALDKHDSVEQRSHVALSCRRLLERLANVLYPPTDKPIDGRKLGKAEYRNRLWRYAEERIESDDRAKVALASLAQVGGRIDSLDKVANKGVHADVETIEMHRLVMGVFLLSYDLLTLKSPDGRAADSYTAKMNQEILAMIKQASSE